MNFRLILEKICQGCCTSIILSCYFISLFGIVKALVENGFDGYVRPDHGRMIWGETGRAGYGLYDRALGATYLNGLFEAVEKMSR